MDYGVKEARVLIYEVTLSKFEIGVEFKKETQKRGVSGSILKNDIWMPNDIWMKMLFSHH